MVAHFGRIPTGTLVALYRFLTDYEAIKIFGISSFVSVLAGFYKLPKLEKPNLESSHTPYIEKRRKRRVLIAVGVLTIVVTVVALWLHSLVPAEIGHVTNPPIQVESFRIALEEFLASFALTVVCQAVYWYRQFEISRNQP